MFTASEAFLLPWSNRIVGEVPVSQGMRAVSRWSVVLALVAGAIAGYLTIVSLKAGATPLGCGAGSGCESVLRSRWSSLFGIPVGALACAAYLGLAVATIRSSRSHAIGPFAVVLATAIIGSALWFIGLQIFVLRALCPWCLADHALGISAAAMTIVGARRTRSAGSQPGLPASVEPNSNPDADDDLFDTRPTNSREAPIDPFAERSGDSAPAGSRSPAPSLAPSLLLGGALTLSLIVLQVAFGKAPAAIARLPKDANSDTGAGPDRAISVLQGRLPIEVHEVPLLGSPDAPQLIVVMFDYCCPHCRETHASLRWAAEVVDRSSMGLILLPTPLNASCNPAIEETEDRFKDSCELAKLALAVWRSSPDQFAEYDSWLFEPELPRSAVEARAEASKLVGEQQLSKTLSDPWIDERIRKNVTAYQESQARVLPILLSPGAKAIVGRADDRNELFKLLESDFGIRAGTLIAP